MKFNFYASKGFTLIELLLVLGIATIISIAGVQAAKKEGENQMAHAAATQMQELNAALTKQIAKNYSAYVASPRVTITIADLQASGLLPTFYRNQTPFGGTINMEVVSSGGTTPNLTGLITTTPWEDSSGNPRYDLLGAAIRKIGAQGGVSYYSANTIAGLNAGWSATAGTTPSTYSFITEPGQLAVRSYTDANGEDNVYLRRDGMLPMLGNLDMGFHDINNAVNISANGWVYANHIAANDATLGSIFSNYIRNTGGIDTAQITGIGTSSVANFEFLAARTRIDTPDIIVTNTTTTGKVRLVDTVTVGAACTPNGLVSKEASGTIVSCQGGVWLRQSNEWTYVTIGGWTSGSFHPIASGVPPWAKEVMLYYQCGTYVGGIFGFQGTGSVGFCSNPSASSYGQGVANANAWINLYNPSLYNLVYISAYR